MVVPDVDLASAPPPHPLHSVQVFSPQFKQRAKTNMLITVGFLMLMCVQQKQKISKRKAKTTMMIIAKTTMMITVGFLMCMCVTKNLSKKNQRQP